MMRSLFFLLVLANLGFAAWSAWYAPQEPPPERPSVPGRDTAPVQARELPSTTEQPSMTDSPPAARVAAEPPPRAAETPEAAAPAGAAEPSPATEPGVAIEPADEGSDDPRRTRAVSNDAVCTSVGPFEARDDAEAVASQLVRGLGRDLNANMGPDGDAPVIRETEGDIWVDYWVNIASLPSVEATRALATLRDGGFDDAYRIRGEQDGDIVSLGVFREMSRAERLRGQIRALGLEPAIVDRYRRGTVYWIDLSVPEDRPLDLGVIDGVSMARIEQRRCEAAR